MTDLISLQSRLVGVMTALVTPFDRDGELDLDGLETHVAFQVKHRVPVLVPCGTIGEFPLLTLAERRAVATRTVMAVVGRSVVMVGVSDPCPETTVVLAQHAREVGADGLLVMTPPFFKLTEAEQLEFWSWLDGRVDLPFVVYSTPANPSGVPSVALLEQISRLPRFAGLKEASPDMQRFHELIRRFGSRFPVIAAVEAPLPYTLLAGSPGLMTSTACFAPGLMGELLNAANAHNVPRLLERFEVVTQFRDLFQAQMNQGYHAYIPFTKAACELIGLPAGNPRLPHRPVTVEERTALAAVLREQFALHVTEAISA